MHDARRVAFEKLPALHGAGNAAPPTQEKPVMQSKHRGRPLASETLTYCPGAQLAGSSRLAPIGHKLPGSHRLHAVVQAK